MLNKVKQFAQNLLNEKCDKEYELELKEKTPYIAWARRTEKETRKALGNLESGVEVVYFEQCNEEFTLQSVKSEFVCFASSDGILATETGKVLEKYFAEHPDADIVYADEDVWADTPQDASQDEYEHRTSVWCKPQWSPDTLLSFQYFGNVFAVRREVFANIEWLKSEDCKVNIYDFILKATESSKPYSISNVLFHKKVSGATKQDVQEQIMFQEEVWGCQAKYNDIKNEYFVRNNINARMSIDAKSGYSYVEYGLDGKDKVSIVIPSKDNPDVLGHCIQSLYELTEYTNFEVVVVDNGSNQENKDKIEKLRDKYSFKYIYDPCEFNFSYMCNEGVEYSTGEYVLLLNDDMEIIQSDWLGKMLGAASQAHIGAVGAKLLYPNSTLIQHVGVTNTFSGPGHKLTKMDDKKCYYYLRNKLNYDMIGVTGACLLVAKSKYLQVGGLSTKLRVAYNDVDLCMKLYEQGYYNVQRNDVILYHHESLSRGDDKQNEEKFKRLMAEKEVLYDMHPQLYHKDPFVGDVQNNGSSEYEPRNIESYEYTNPKIDIVEVKADKYNLVENHAIMVVVEECQKDKFVTIQPSGKVIYLVKGWAYVPGVDNARYQMKLVLHNEQGQAWEILIDKQFRKDVADILPNEVNVGLTGFCCWIEQGILPTGVYTVALAAKDKCSRQILYRETEKQLVIAD